MSEHNEAIEILNKCLVYQIEGDDAVHLVIDGERIGAFGALTAKAIALLRFDAARRSLKRPEPSATDELAALTSPRETRAGTHLFKEAKSLGWKDDGEGAYEFLIRLAYEAGMRRGHSSTAASGDGWRPIEEAPKDGARFWGKVDDDAIAMLWHEGFGAFVSSWRQIEMAAGYTIDGETCRDHSPVKHTPEAWMPLPAPPANPESAE